jgi:general secretion pathway protein I
MVSSSRQVTGFTLLEAMVALVIVALGMMAVNTQINRYVVTARYVEDKTLASWIGTNTITELSLGAQWPDLGTDSDDIDYAGRRWHVVTEVSETPVENLRRVDVAISASDSPDDVLHRVSGLLEPPAPRGFPPVHWGAPRGPAEG